MIIWLASMPRSGNSFFREVLEAMYGITTYTIYDNEDRVFGAGRDRYLFDCLDELPIQDEVVFVKTHRWPPDRTETIDSPQSLFHKRLQHIEQKAIYLVRDGRDVCVSYVHWAKAHNWNPKLFADVLRDVIVSGEWADHVNAWLKPNVADIWISFEPFIEQPVEAMRIVIDHMNLDLKERPTYHIPTFDELQKQSPTIYRRGVTDGLREEMTPELEELFWKHNGKAMNRIGYHQHAYSRAV